MEIQYQAKDELEKKRPMCPRLVNTRDEGTGLRIAFFGECIGADCAWWDSECQWCCIRSIPHEIVAVSDWVKELSELMPRRR